MKLGVFGIKVTYLIPHQDVRSSNT